MITTRKIFTLLIPVFLSCSQVDPRAGSTSPKPVSNPQLTIDIQPFSDVPGDYVRHVETELKKLYSSITVKKPVHLPSAAFYTKRRRYRADSLISILKRTTPNGHVTIGLTTKDISHTKGDIEDYGIMGLGYQPGPSCVISTFRLSKKNLLEQYFKLAIHELGHTQGLPHCPEKTCYMRDAEGKNHADEETRFCTKCRSVLISKGWTFPK